MTIAIKITNEDIRENAIVEVRTVNSGVKSVLPITNRPGQQLKGGESLTQLVHSTQSLIVEEIQNG